MLIWVPVGLSTAEVAGVLTAVLKGVSAKEHRGHRPHDADDLFQTRLDLHSAGPVTAVAPELCGPARVWRSLTPYLPVRHRKRTDLAEYLSQDIRYELAYRDRLPATVHRLWPAGSDVDPWASTFRRHRLKEGRERRRPGYGLRLVFDAPVSGPLLLGQLSHFGFGIFVPEGGDS
jgi:CRISPR-associated protein Csb2